MTVREKAALTKALAKHGIARVMVKSNIVGELQIQCEDGGKVVNVFIPSSLRSADPSWVNLLDFATLAAWRDSKSLLNAVRMGYLTVRLEQ